MASRLFVVGLLGICSCEGCDRAQTYTTTAELLDIERFDGAGVTKQVNFELRYADCPGDNRRILRGDEDLSKCTNGLKEGDKVPVQILSKWSSERGTYRSEITRLGDCAVKQDPKEEANYERVQICSDVKTTGAVVGVHCDRARTKALVEKCPFLRRN